MNVAADIAAIKIPNVGFHMTKETTPATVDNASNREFWHKVAEVQSLNKDALVGPMDRGATNAAEIVDAANHVVAVALLFARNTAYGVAPQEPSMQRDLALALKCLSITGEMANNPS